MLFIFDFLKKVILSVLRFATAKALSERGKDWEVREK